MSGVAESELVERASAVERIRDAIDSASAGEGRLVLIEGEAGVGKTTLLALAAGVAADAGVRVCSARGTEFECDLPNGVVRQLFASFAQDSDPERRASCFAGAAGLAEGVLSGAGEVIGDAFAIRHAMYWLLANIAADGPVLISVDDVQWADLMSVRWLGYLSERLEGLPVVVVAAVRVGDTREPPELDAVRANPATEPLAVESLSAAATGQLVRGQLPEAADAFVSAVHFHTGGNPFLIHELLDAAAREGIRADSAGVHRLGELCPEQVGRSVLRRLRRLSAEAAALAEAVAIAGDGGEVRHAAAVAGLSVDDAVVRLDELVAARLLARGRPLRFVHPMVRRAVEDRIPQGRRSVGHRRVAELLERESAGARAAVHLLEVEPAGVAWVVARLRAEARHALERGAPEAAATFLERALQEPPDESERVAVLIELGETELLLTGLTKAIGHLEDAERVASAPADIERCARLLSRALVASGAVPDAVRVLASAIRQLAEVDHERSLRLEVEALLQSQTGRSLNARTAERLRELAGGIGSASPAERALLVAGSYEQAVRWDGQHDAVARLVDGAFETGLIDDFGCDHTIVGLGMATLIFCRAWARTQEVIDNVLLDARRRGSSRGVAFHHAFRARLGYERGDYIAAEADARVALDLSSEAYPTGKPFAVRDLAASLVARGELAAAEEQFKRYGLAHGDVAPTVFTFAMLLTRAGLRREQGRIAEAVADIERLDAFNRVRGGYPRTWVPEVIRTLVAARRRDEASDVAERHAAEAQAWGNPIDIAEALRVLAMVRPTSAELPLYEEAVAVLDGVAAPMQLANALADFGSALRRHNHPRAAREPLRNALDIAHRHGAIPLERRIHEELLAAGARPRRKERTGVDALTSSERRVVELAVQGLSNPEIAQTLFVTRKTVEKHLGGAYLKLAISSRAELASAMTF